MRLLAEARRAGPLRRRRDAARARLELDPASAGARLRYAAALFHQQKGPRPRPARAAARAEPGGPRLPQPDGRLPRPGRRIRPRDRDLRGLLADDPSQPKVWLNYGHALRTAGPLADAVAAYRRAIALAPGLGDAYWSLANLKVAPFTPDEEAAIDRALERPGAAEDRLHLHYALGKALEDRGDYRRLVRATMPRAPRSAAREGHYDADETTALVGGRRRCSRRSSSPRGRAPGAAPTRRSSSSACRAPARR